MGEWTDFSTSYSDPNGADDISLAFFFLDKTPPVSSGGLAAVYYQPADLLMLVGGGTCKPGQSGTLSTDYITLDCGSTSVSGSGETLTINWHVRPETCFDGTCGLNMAYGLVMDKRGLSAFGVFGWWILRPAS